MNIKTYEYLLIAEMNIFEKGYVSYEDLMQVCECRPWIITALSEELGLMPIDVKSQCADKLVSAIDYFKAVNIFLRSNLENLPVGWYSGEVYVS